MSMFTRKALPRRLTVLAAGAILAFGAVPSIAADAFTAQLKQVQQRWAEANYHEEGKQQKKAFDALLQDARDLARDNPQRAEALIWQGIVASTYAGVKGPFGAMSLAKEARDVLKAAEAIDASALDGSVYTSLGALYYKVPGGMIGFGDKDLAREYLTKALQLNPDGIDSNFFYGEFMYEQKQYEQARDALLKAQQAPPRPDRQLADEGRRGEVSSLLGQVNEKLAKKS